MSFPTSGIVPVTLSADLFGPTAKKRKRDEGEMIALKYAFKPGSMGSSTETTIQTNELGARVLRADTTVFDIREEQSKARECVLIYDPTSNSFTVHSLPSTYHLTLNRSASSATNRSAGRSSTSSSSASSSSLPLAEKQQQTTSSTIDAPAKKSRPSEIASSEPSKNRKNPPNAPIPSHGAIPTFQKTKTQGKGKAGARKSLPSTAGSRGKKTKDKIQTIEPKGKFKSAETIEDSDEEAALIDGTNQGAQEEEEEDEFAKMLQESVNESVPSVQTYEEDDEEDEDEDEEEEDDDELGGALLAVRQHAPSNAFGNGESEWL